MFSYSFVQWLFFFYFYCFFGWCFESAYVSIRSKKLINRGFARGPYLPLYGSGAIILLVVSKPFADNIFLVYISGAIGATVLEYFTGVVMEALFKVRYWDYSNQKFQYKGHICLSSTIAWGFLTILMTGYVHSYVERIVYMIPDQVLTEITFTITAIFFADFSLSFKAAMDLRDVLVKLEAAKLELSHIKKRMDVLIAVANDEISNKAAGVSNRLSTVGDKMTLLEDKMTNVGELMANVGDKFKVDFLELRDKYRKIIEEHERSINIKDGILRHHIISNPTMYSERFKEVLEEIKNRIRNRD